MTDNYKDVGDVRRWKILVLLLRDLIQTCEVKGYRFVSLFLNAFDVARHMRRFGVFSSGAVAPINNHYAQQLCTQTLMC